MISGDQIKRFFAVDNPWPWLAYLALFFYPWLFRAPTQGEIAVALVAIPAFLALYFLGYRAGPRRVFHYAVAVAALGFGSSLIAVNAGVLIVYAGAMFGWSLPQRRALIAVIVLVAATLAFGLLRDGPFLQWAPIAFFTAMTGFATYMTGALESKNQALSVANAEAERQAARAERERIARDLHDLLGHTLTVIAVKADLAGRLADADAQRARAEIADIQSTARRALKDMRLAVDDMKRASLVAELAHARAALAAADVILTAEARLPPIPAALEQPLALLVRESVTNIVRHARASACTIRIECNAEHVRLEVADDGRGGVIKDGNGIAGMRERVAALGGSFAVRSDRGTTVEAVLPLGAGAAA